MSGTSFRTKLYLPAQAAAEAEATLTGWKVSAGDAFAKGSVLAEAESAKTSFTFEAPCDGTVVKLLCADGDTIPFDEPVIEIETADASFKEAIPTAAELGEESRMAVNVIPGSVSGPRSGEICMLGIGGYLPERVVKNAELLEHFPDITEDYLRGVTGIKQRHWAADGEKPSGMAFQAAREALEKSNIAAKDLGAIIVATTTPDVTMPSTACILQDRLGARGIPAFDLNAACSGWLYGVSIARGLVVSGVADNALVVGVDLQSRLLDNKDKTTYFLFGDGAGATVVSGSVPGHPIRQEILTADAKGLHMARRLFPGDVIPGPGADIDPWIRLDGPALFRFATESFSRIIREVIDKNGWKPEDVRWVVPHQANGRILKASAKKSGVAFDRFYLNIDHVGNTSSASIPLALIEIEKGLQNRDKLVLCSVGAGITAAAVSVEWHKA
ncbi:MAG: beta-ketoacyl-ACP synthase III [Chitinivibrionales bacterium]|nr:beta-ketoacyl-ACP synthase III [Chitinivibrionales bacterium]MBD3394444.1 beta-ketoacyl-ACP synthase III [Chitinivibrionales bacterium]